MLTPLTAGLVVAGLLRVRRRRGLRLRRCADRGPRRRRCGLPRRAEPRRTDRGRRAGSSPARRSRSAPQSAASWRTPGSPSRSLPSVGSSAASPGGSVGPDVRGRRGRDRGDLLLVGATLAGVAVGALFGFVLSRTTLVVSTAFIGAAFASRSITPATLDAATAQTSVEPLLFDVTAPAFLAVFALGALSQFGLFKFGYVTKLVGLLPGASVDREQRQGRRGR